MERKADGTPAAWIPGGITTKRAPELIQTTSDNPTFNRTMAPQDGNDGKTWVGNSNYMPTPFVPTLPKLGHEPVRHIYRDPPITTLDDFTIGDIKSTLQSHTIGQFANSARLADAMTGDDRVASVLGTRVKGMLGLPFKVSPAKPKDGNTDAAKHIAKETRRLWEQMCPRPQVAEFMQWAIQMGFALAEIVWTARQGMWIPTIRTWHPQLVYYRYDERAYYVITMDGPVRVTPGDGKWILYAPHGEYRGWMHGIVRTCAAPWRYRTYGLRDWARHSEKHGFPWVLARVPLASSAEDKIRFYASLNALGSEPTIAAPQVDQENRFDIDLKEATHSAADVFDKFTTRCDTLISCAVLGQNLTTEVQGGSYAAATVHGQVRQDFLEADSRTLSECLRLQLLRPFCVYNFEHGRRYIPKIMWDTTPPDDKKVNADTISTFATALAALAASGFPLDIQTFAQQFGVPMIPGETKLKPPAQAVPPAQAKGVAEMLGHLQNILPGLQQIHAHLDKLITVK